MQSKFRLCQGFTLIELLVVISILSLITLLVLPDYNKKTQKTRMETAYSDSVALQSIISASYNINGNLAGIVYDSDVAENADAALQAEIEKTNILQNDYIQRVQINNGNIIITNLDNNSITLVPILDRLTGRISQWSCETNGLIDEELLPELCKYGSSLWQSGGGYVECPPGEYRATSCTVCTNQGMVWNGVECMCRSPEEVYVATENACIKPVDGVTYDGENNQLTCPEGATLINNTCVTCPDGQYYDLGTEDCQCQMAGYVKDGDICYACDQVPRLSAVSPDIALVWNEDTKQCACPIEAGKQFYLYTMVIDGQLKGDCIECSDSIREIWQEDQDGSYCRCLGGLERSTDVAYAKFADASKYGYQCVCPAANPHEHIDTTNDAATVIYCRSCVTELGEYWDASQNKCRCEGNLGINIDTGYCSCPLQFRSDFGNYMQSWVTDIGDLTYDNSGWNAIYPTGQCVDPSYIIRHSICLDGVSLCRFVNGVYQGQAVCHGDYPHQEILNGKPICVDCSGVNVHIDINAPFMPNSVYSGTQCECSDPNYAKQVADASTESGLSCVDCPTYMTNSIGTGGTCDCLPDYIEVSASYPGTVSGRGVDYIIGAGGLLCMSCDHYRPEGVGSNCDCIAPLFVVSDTASPASYSGEKCFDCNVYKPNSESNGTICVCPAGFTEIDNIATPSGKECIACSDYIRYSIESGGSCFCTGAYTGWFYDYLEPDYYTGKSCHYAGDCPVYKPSSTYLNITVNSELVDVCSCAYGYNAQVPDDNIPASLSGNKCVSCNDYQPNSTYINWSGTGCSCLDPTYPTEINDVSTLSGKRCIISCPVYKTNSSLSGNDCVCAADYTEVSGSYPGTASGRGTSYNFGTGGLLCMGCSHYRPDGTGANCDCVAPLGIVPDNNVPAAYSGEKCEDCSINKPNSIIVDGYCTCPSDYIELSGSYPGSISGVAVKYDFGTGGVVCMDCSHYRPGGAGASCACNAPSIAITDEASPTSYSGERCVASCEDYKHNSTLSGSECVCPAGSIEINSITSLSGKECIACENHTRDSSEYNGYCVCPTYLDDGGGYSYETWLKPTYYSGRACRIESNCTNYKTNSHKYWIYIDGEYVKSCLCGYQGYDVEVDDVSTVSGKKCITCAEHKPNSIVDKTIVPAACMCSDISYPLEVNDSNTTSGKHCIANCQAYKTYSGLRDYDCVCPDDYIEITGSYPNSISARGVNYDFGSGGLLCMNCADYRPGGIGASCDCVAPLNIINDNASPTSYSGEKCVDCGEYKPNSSLNSNECVCPVDYVELSGSYPGSITGNGVNYDFGSGGFLCMNCADYRPGGTGASCNCLAPLITVTDNNSPVSYTGQRCENSCGDYKTNSSLSGSDCVCATDNIEITGSYPGSISGRGTSYDFGSGGFLCMSCNDYRPSGTGAACECVAPLGAVTDTNSPASYSGEKCEECSVYKPNSIIVDGYCVCGYGAIEIDDGSAPSGKRCIACIDYIGYSKEDNGQCVCTYGFPVYDKREAEFYTGKVCNMELNGCRNWMYFAEDYSSYNLNGENVKICVCSDFTKGNVITVPYQYSYNGYACIDCDFYKPNSLLNSSKVGNIYQPPQDIVLDPGVCYCPSSMVEVTDFNPKSFSGKQCLTCALAKPNSQTDTGTNPPTCPCSDPAYPYQESDTFSPSGLRCVNSCGTYITNSVLSGSECACPSDYIELSSNTPGSLLGGGNKYDFGAGGLLCMDCQDYKPNSSGANCDCAEPLITVTDNSYPMSYSEQRCVNSCGEYKTNSVLSGSDCSCPSNYVELLGSAASSISANGVNYTFGTGDFLCMSCNDYRPGGTGSSCECVAPAVAITDNNIPASYTKEICVDCNLYKTNSSLSGGECVCASDYADASGSYPGTVAGRGTSYTLGTGGLVCMSCDHYRPGGTGANCECAAPLVSVTDDNVPASYSGQQCVDCQVYKPNSEFNGTSCACPVGAIEIDNAGTPSGKECIACGDYIRYSIESGGSCVCTGSYTGWLYDYLEPDYYTGKSCHYAGGCSVYKPNSTYFSIIVKGEWATICPCIYGYNAQVPDDNIPASLSGNKCVSCNDYQPNSTYINWGETGCSCLNPTYPIEINDASTLSGLRCIDSCPVYKNGSSLSGSECVCASDYADASGSYPGTVAGRGTSYTLGTGGLVCMSCDHYRPGGTGANCECAAPLGALTDDNVPASYSGEKCDDCSTAKTNSSLSGGECACLSDYAEISGSYPGTVAGRGTSYAFGTAGLLCMSCDHYRPGGTGANCECAAPLVSLTDNNVPASYSGQQCVDCQVYKPNSEFNGTSCACPVGAIEIDNAGTPSGKECIACGDYIRYSIESGGSCVCTGSYAKGPVYEYGWVESTYYTGKTCYGPGGCEDFYKPDSKSSTMEVNGETVNICYCGFSSNNVEVQSATSQSGFKCVGCNTYKPRSKRNPSLDFHDCYCDDPAYPVEINDASTLSGLRCVEGCSIYKVNSSLSGGECVCPSDYADASGSYPGTVAGRGTSYTLGTGGLVCMSCDHYRPGGTGANCECAAPLVSVTDDNVPASYSGQQCVDCQVYKPNSEFNGTSCACPVGFTEINNITTPSGLQCIECGNFIRYATEINGSCGCADPPYGGHIYDYLTPTYLSGRSCLYYTAELTCDTYRPGSVMFYDLYTTYEGIVEWGAFCKCWYDNTARTVHPSSLSGEQCMTCAAYQPNATAIAWNVEGCECGNPSYPLEISDMSVPYSNKRCIDSCPVYKNGSSLSGGECVCPSDYADASGSYPGTVAGRGTSYTLGTGGLACMSCDHYRPGGTGANCECAAPLVSMTDDNVPASYSGQQCVDCQVYKPNSEFNGTSCACPVGAIEIDNAGTPSGKECIACGDYMYNSVESGGTCVCTGGYPQEIYDYLEASYLSGKACIAQNSCDAYKPGSSSFITEVNATTVTTCACVNGKQVADDNVPVSASGNQCVACEVYKPNSVLVGTDCVCQAGAIEVDDGAYTSGKKCIACLDYIGYSVENNGACECSSPEYSSGPIYDDLLAEDYYTSKTCYYGTCDDYIDRSSLTTKIVNGEEVETCECLSTTGYVFRVDTKGSSRYDLLESTGLSSPAWRFDYYGGAGMALYGGRCLNCSGLASNSQPDNVENPTMCVCDPPRAWVLTDNTPYDMQQTEFTPFHAYDGIRCHNSFGLFTDELCAQVKTNGIIGQVAPYTQTEGFFAGRDLIVSEECFCPDNYIDIAGAYTDPSISGRGVSYSFGLNTGLCMDCNHYRPGGTGSNCDCMAPLVAVSDDVSPPSYSGEMCVDCSVYKPNSSVVAVECTCMPDYTELSGSYPGTVAGRGTSYAFGTSGLVCMDCEHYRPGGTGASCDCLAPLSVISDDAVPASYSGEKCVNCHAYKTNSVLSGSECVCPSDYIELSSSYLDSVLGSGVNYDFGSTQTLCMECNHYRPGGTGSNCDCVAPLGIIQDNNVAISYSRERCEECSVSKPNSVLSGGACVCPAGMKEIDSVSSSSGKECIDCANYTRYSVESGGDCICTGAYNNEYYDNLEPSYYTGRSCSIGNCSSYMPGSQDAMMTLIDGSLGIKQCVCAGAKKVVDDNVPSSLSGYQCIDCNSYQPNSIAVYSSLEGCWCGAASYFTEIVDLSTISGLRCVDSCAVYKPGSVLSGSDCVCQAGLTEVVNAGTPSGLECV